MSLTRHLATIDRLRVRPFPATAGRSGAWDSGPGYHVAELATGDDFFADDGTAWAAAEEQFAAECEALALRLSDRWGEPLLVRLPVPAAPAVGDADGDPERAYDADRSAGAGDADGTGGTGGAGTADGPAEPAGPLPEPWRRLGAHLPWARVWRDGERWIALGVSQWGPQLPFQLLAVVAAAAPPHPSPGRRAKKPPVA